MRRNTLYNRIFPKVMAMLLVLTLLLPMVPAAEAAEYEGSCGEGLSWSYEAGTLTITGSGAMEDYDSAEQVPWYAFREDIFRVELPEGLRSVGDLAFTDCRNLRAVTIPDGVRRIGAQAFRNCTGLNILHLPDGLERIGENAFDMCTSLQDLRLPDTLEALEWQAFYRCYSLRKVEIPASVEEMGAGVFSYCYGLIQAVIHAPLEALPQWTFYGCSSLKSIELPPETKDIGLYGVKGCESLEVVYYDGEPGDAEKLKQQISEENRDFAENGDIVEENFNEGETSTREETDENGDTVREDTTVTDTDESTITVTEKENISDPEAEKPPTEISGTVVEEDGWEQVEDAIKDALQDSDSVEVEIYLPTDTKIPDSMIENLAGKDVTITVTNSDGTKYTLDFSQIDKKTKVEGLDLSYRLEILEKTYEELGGADGYRLIFSKSCSINAQFLIQLPMGNARKSISLFQVEGGKLRLLQSVLADDNAVALFYLGSVDKDTKYLLGIDVPTVQQTDLLIPKSLEEEYGITEQINNVDYVITGRKSSWGIGFLEVNQILLGIMLSTAAFVGLTMYALNKRKIRKGILPGWDDVDDSES